MRSLLYWHRGDQEPAQEQWANLFSCHQEKFWQEAIRGWLCLGSSENIPAAKFIPTFLQ